MNRQTILARIHHHLRECRAETGEVRPLGELVSRVGRDLRSKQHSSAPINHAEVIPIEQVAAFVDGQLDSDQVQRVCRAALIDNSVLAELIAAVRARSERASSLPPLSTDLTAQLMAMGSDLPVGPRAKSPLLTVARPPQAVAPPRQPKITAQSSPSRNGPSRNGPSRNGQLRTRPKPKRRGVWIAAVLAIAATVLGILSIFWQKPKDATAPHRVAIDDQTDRIVDPGVVGPSVDPDPNDSQPLLVETGRQDEHVKPPPAINQPSVPTPAEQNVPQLANDDRDSMSESIEFPQVDAVPKESPNSAAPVRPPQMAEMRWQQITGLLAAQPARLPGQTTSNSAAQRIAPWTSISPGSTATTSASSLGTMLRTMPLSRAEAQLEGGGRIVIAADSGMQVSRSSQRASAEIDLHHGSVAVVDLPPGTVLDFVRAGQSVARLRFVGQASAVVQRGETDLLIHISQGTIEVNDQPHEAESLAVSQDRSVQSIESPKRLPGWVDRPTDAVSIPRTILAQIAETDDVRRTLSQRINELGLQPRLSAADRRELATLTSWQAAMAGEHLFRLAGSRVPAMRYAALDRLVNLPPSDPRYRRTWMMIQRAAGNQNRVGQIRRWCEMARESIRPNAAQLNQMASGLSSGDTASRALADFVLRKFYGNGPPFDPTWTGQQQQRAINLWRARLGLPAARAAAANAAIDRAPN